MLGKLLSSAVLLLISLTATQAAPTLSSVPDTTLANAKVNYESALAKLKQSLLKWDAAVRAKSDIDLLFVRSYLFSGVSVVPELVLRNCTLNRCDPGLAPVFVEVSDSTSACACVREDHASYAAMLKERRDQNVNRPEMAQQLDSRAMTDVKDPEPESKDTNFTYVPPPKTDITPQLLGESLALQPQDTATISSIIGHFPQGIISYGIQLNGLVAATMTLNASTDLPCDSIGDQLQAELELRPKDIDNGTTQTYIPDCSIVAVNMYDPNVVNYWVQNMNGSLFSVVGSNKLVKIDQLNSTASTALVLRAKAAGTQKRVEPASRRHADQTVERAHSSRGISPPDYHSATVSEEACAAIKCNNNNGLASVFNPFTKTCGCRDPVFVETDRSS